MLKVFGKELRDLRQKDRDAYKSLYMKEERTIKRFKSHFADV